MQQEMFETLFLLFIAYGKPAVIQPRDSGYTLPSAALYVMQTLEWSDNKDMHTHAYTDTDTYMEVTQ